MFLLYRNRGERRYGQSPILLHPRNSWSFQIIVEGSCSMLISESDAVREKRLLGPVFTVAGPGFVHGWSGRKADVCEVMIFHFDEAEYALRSVVGKAGFRCFRMPAEDLPAFHTLYDRCNEVRKSPGFATPDARRRAGFFAPLIYGIVALELTLYFLRHIPRAELGPTPDFGTNKVAEALAWYEANLASGPNILDVAHAVHLSQTHLRRLFHKVRGMSPQAAFTRVQFDRAKWLMRSLAMPLERVAESAGFSSASAFSRSFKKECGVPPKIFRANLPRH